MAICIFPNKDFGVIAKMDKPHCRYHKRGVKRYFMDELGPAGLCLEAYHAMYPYAFAMLYNPGCVLEAFTRLKKFLIPEGMLN